MKKFFAEFKEFAIKGNMLDLAIGVVIGTSFNAVVTSIVKDIFTPIIGIIIGGRDFSGLAITVGESSITYGVFIQAMINFLITAFCLFLVVKTMNRFKRKKEEEPAPEPEEPKKSDEVLLLEEIRDLLSKK
ncbi:MAG: large conductance mechanosensitive channel protein MscL [Ruminococcaceae bacterium]|nr:large conductance mechanosensitive channel protein MscL [Oscillospiraceae bacterium]